MRRFAALTAASLVSNICVIPCLLFTGTDANPSAPLRCSMMNHFVIVSAILVEAKVEAKTAKQAIR